MSLGELMTAMGLLGAAVAFTVGLHRYERAQRWKRAEWVARQMHEFSNNLLIVNALRMLDWGNRRLLLHPERTDPDRRHVQVLSDDVIRALRKHDVTPSTREAPQFTDDEAVIRDCFDALGARFERLDAFINVGLIRLADILPYVEYWLKLLAKAPSSRVRAVRTYFQTYGFSGALALVERYVDATRHAQAADVVETSPLG